MSAAQIVAIVYLCGLVGIVAAAYIDRRFIHSHLRKRPRTDSETG